MKTPRIDAVNDRFAFLRTELSTEHARAMRGRGRYVAASRTLPLPKCKEAKVIHSFAAAAAVEDTMARSAAIGCASMAVASLPKVR